MVRLPLLPATFRALIEQNVKQMGTLNTKLFRLVACFWLMLPTSRYLIFLFVTITYLVCFNGSCLVS